MPTAHKTDPARIERFHFEGDPRRMRPLGQSNASYFDAFGLEPRLNLDSASLRESFLALSREFHPDFFANESEAERAESLRRTALINNAYKTLRDDQKRAEYLIFLVADDIEAGTNAVPPELLEEMFDIQEAGEDLREARLAANEEKLRVAEAKVAPLRDQVQKTRKSLEERLQSLFAKYDATVESGDTEAAHGVLKDIRITLDRMNYLRTVLRNLR